MSDLTASHCGCNQTNEGCGCGNDSSLFGGNNSCIWIIILLFFCGGCGNGSSGLFSGNRCGCEHEGCGCGSNNWIWIIILLFFCGGCGNNNGCC